jgi:hypothetical protein
MITEYPITSWFWINAAGDEVWLDLNDNNNIEIEPAAFEGLLRQAGYEPVE